MKDFCQHAVEIIGCFGLEGISFEKLLEEISENRYYNEYRSFNFDEISQSFLIKHLITNDIIKIYGIPINKENPQDKKTYSNEKVIHSVYNPETGDCGISEHYFIRVDISEIFRNEIKDSQLPTLEIYKQIITSYEHIYFVANQKYREMLLNYRNPNNQDIVRFCVLETILKKRDKGLLQTELYKHGLDSARIYYEISKLNRDNLIVRFENFGIYDEIPLHLSIHYRFYKKEKFYQLSSLNQETINKLSFDEYIALTWGMIRGKSLKLVDLYNFVESVIKPIHIAILPILAKNIVIFLYRCNCIVIEFNGEKISSKSFKRIFPYKSKLYYLDEINLYPDLWMNNADHDYWNIKIIDIMTNKIANDVLNEDENTFEVFYSHTRHKNNSFSLKYEYNIFAAFYETIENSNSTGTTINELSTKHSLEYYLVRKIVNRLEKIKLIKYSKFKVGKVNIKRIYSISAIPDTCNKLLPFATSNNSISISKNEKNSNNLQLNKKVGNGRLKLIAKDSNSITNIDCIDTSNELDTTKQSILEDSRNSSPVELLLIFNELETTIKKYKSENVSRKYFWESSITIDRIKFVINYMFNNHGILHNFKECLGLLNEREKHLSAARSTEDSLQKIISNVLIINILTKIHLKIQHNNTVREYYTYKLNTDNYEIDHSCIVKHFLNVIVHEIPEMFEKITENILFSMISRSLMNKRILNVDNIKNKILIDPKLLLLKEHDSAQWIDFMFQHYNYFFSSLNPSRKKFPKFSRIKVLHLYLLTITYNFKDYLRKIVCIEYNPVFQYFTFPSMIEKNKIKNHTSPWVSIIDILYSCPIVLLIYIVGSHVDNDVRNLLISQKSHYLSSFSEIVSLFSNIHQNVIINQLYHLISQLFFLRLVAANKNSTKANVHDCKIFLLDHINLYKDGEIDKIFTFIDLTSVEEFWKYLFFKSRLISPKYGKYRDFSYKTFVFNQLNTEDDTLIIANVNHSGPFGYPYNFNFSLISNWNPSTISHPIKHTPKAIKPKKNHSISLNTLIEDSSNKIYISSNDEANLLTLYIIYRLKPIQTRKLCLYYDEIITKLYDSNIQTKNISQLFSLICKNKPLNRFLRKLRYTFRNNPKIITFEENKAITKNYMELFHIVFRIFKQYCVSHEYIKIDSTTKILTIYDSIRKPLFYQHSWNIELYKSYEKVLKYVISMYIFNRSIDLSPFISFLYHSMGFKKCCSFFRGLIQSGFFHKISINDEIKEDLETFTAFVQRLFTTISSEYQSLIISPIQPLVNVRDESISIEKLASIFYFHFLSSIEFFACPVNHEYSEHFPPLLNVNIVSKLKNNKYIDINDSKSDQIKIPIDEHILELRLMAIEISEIFTIDYDKSYALLTTYYSYLFTNFNDSEYLIKLLTEYSLSDRFELFQYILASYSSPYNGTPSNINTKISFVKNLKSKIVCTILNQPGISYNMIATQYEPIVSRSVIKAILGILVDQNRIYEIKPINIHSTVITRNSGITYIYRFIQSQFIIYIEGSGIN